MLRYLWMGILAALTVWPGLCPAAGSSPQPGAENHAVRLHTRAFFARPAGGLTAASSPATEPASAPGIQAANHQLDYSASYALVVGIDRYDNWPGLEYAAQDAREMAAMLEMQGFQIYLLIDAQATRQNILANLKSIGDGVDGNSRVVFYFAGHGQTEDLPGGRERGYLVPVDADVYDWQRTMLPMDQLNRRIKQLAAKHILMAFDSCYSGLGLTRSLNRHPENDSAYIQKMMRTRSIQILTAGSRSEQAIEAAGHGLFTDHLLAALSGAADINADGYITATEIYATLRPSITRKSFSHQTPQFGYIEGNGDIIFLNTPPVMPSAAVLIETAVSGIDVWAGTSEIGSRLPAGRHQLQAKAGQTSIIVKKGGRTLYRENVLLSPGRSFPIRIGLQGREPETRDAFSAVTIVNRNVEDYSNSIACDLDDDGREEIITAAGKQLYAFKSNGAIVWRKEFSHPITLDLADDWNSQPAIGLSALEQNEVHLMLLNRHGERIWQHYRNITRYHRGKPDGGGSIAKLADIDGDGRKEVIAIARAQYSLKPRGLIVYDHNAEELWRYSMGPSPQNIVIWPKDRGRPDIIIGTFSSGKGNNVIQNDTSDMQAYVISIDGYGRTNWIIPIGEFYNGVGVFLADSAGSGSSFLYAHKYTSPFLREDTGAVYRISRSGNILNQFDTATSILSITASSSSGSSSGILYAADSQSNLYQLDESLNLLQKKTWQTDSPHLQIRLVGVHDYDGDGSPDLLLYTFNRLLSDRNPLTVEHSNDQAFYSNLKFQVISHDFSKVLKNVSIGETWANRRGFSVKDFQRPETAFYPFMALSDKITVFNFEN